MSSLRPNREGPSFWEMKLMSDELAKAANEHTNKQNSLEPCLIYKLPEHVLGTIFQKLTFVERLRVERVSWRFRRAVRTFGWRNVSAIYYNNEKGIRRRPACEGKDRLTNELIIVLLSRVGSLLCELELCPSKEEKNNVNASVLESLKLTPNVVSLRLGIVLESWVFLPLIARQLPRLKSIYFDGCFRTHKPYGHGDDTDENIIINYANEICLGLRIFFNICSQLEELNFVSICIPNEFFALLPLNIREISLVCGDLTDEDLMCVAERCPLLRHLSLTCSSSEFFTVSGLCAMIAKLNGLTSFHLIEESLTIDETARKDEEATDEEIDLLGKTIGDLKCLERLILYTDTIDAKKLRDSIPFRLRTEQLKELQIGYSRLMGAEKLEPEPFIVGRTLAALECRTDEISDEALIFATRRAVRIESLCVKDCRTISAKSLIEVVRCCKSLRKLSIAPEHFTDDFLEALNEEMRSRHGDTAPRTADDEKRRLQIKISCFVSASKRTSPWIEFI